MFKCPFDIVILFILFSIYCLQSKNLSVFSYEPELFPALIYRLVKPRIVLLIFVNGKIVITGKFKFLENLIFQFIFPFNVAIL